MFLVATAKRHKFPRSQRVGWEKSPTDHFNEITPSLYNHRVTPIATNNGKFNYTINYIISSDVIIAVGSWNPYNENAELLSVDGSTWTGIDKYPFVMGIDMFTFESIFEIIFQGKSP